MNRNVWIAWILALTLLAAGCQNPNTTAGPSQPTAAPTQSTAGPTQPTAEPTQPTAGPTQPTAGPTQPTAGPTQPTAEPTQPTAGPTQPTTAPTQPTTAPTQPTTVPTQPLNPTAPDFTARDWDGGTVRLSDYFGRPIVLNFWASWCGPCRAEMPDFDRIYRLYGDRVQFLMVNLTTGDYGVEYVQALIREEGFAFPVLFDMDGTAGDAYGVEYIPFTFFIDEKGDLVEAVNQGISAQELERRVLQMLSGAK